MEVIKNLINMFEHAQKFGDTIEIMHVENYIKALKEIDKDFISKDEIKDKIKELKKECVDCRYRKMLNCKNQCTIGGTIKALKELLNKED